jgi:WD40 repeat protein
LIALGQSRRPEPTTTQKVLGENLNIGLDKTSDHAMMIEVAAYIPSNQWRPDIEKYITCTLDGVVRLWSSAGQPLKTTMTLTGASAYVLCAAPLSKYNVVAIASNDHKIRFFSFEPRLRLDLQYDCGNCQAMTAHCFAVQVKVGDGSERTTLLAYLVWGDDHGCLHFVVEDVLMATRSATFTPTVHADKVAKLSPKNFSMKLFSGWVTRIDFLTGELRPALADSGSPELQLFVSTETYGERFS